MLNQSKVRYRSGNAYLILVLIQYSSFSILYRHNLCQTVEYSVVDRKKEPFADLTAVLALFPTGHLPNCGPKAFYPKPLLHQRNLWNCWQLALRQHEVKCESQCSFWVCAEPTSTMKVVLTSCLERRKWTFQRTKCKSLWYASLC